MRHPLGEEKEVKKERKKVESGRNSAADTHAESTDTLESDPADEVDPADFFDPEEFGYRRGHSYDR